ncbi:MAG: hypothetical protein COB42_04145 [Sulfurimonas sp.]|nr:MAG: hypothetical protein COB42_04145 [Sulfurimonas sp.]
MNIAVIGNNYFGPKIAKELQRYDSLNIYIYYDTNGKTSDKIKFLINIFKIDVVYSFSASISGGGALNIALKFNKKIIQHFIGSDVLSAIEDFNNKKINYDLINRSQYLCIEQHLQEELKTININAITKLIIVAELPKVKHPKLPESFVVLAYIGNNNPIFYGINTIIKLANDFKEIEFRVAGLKNYPNIPSNVKLLGWVDMNKEYQNSVVHIRMPQHDGLGFSVLEALSYGLVVFRNYNSPHVNYFKNYDDLVMQMREVKNAFNKGKLEINYDAINFIENKYKKEFFLKDIINILLKDNNDS